MFWRFGGYANISTIDTLLEKDNVQLEELLEDADLIQELKSHNAKLVEYLRDASVLQKLLGYVVVPKLEPVAVTGTSTGEANDDDDSPTSTKGKGLSLSFKRPRASSRAADPDSDDGDLEKKRNRYAFVAAEILSSDNWSIYEAVLDNKDMLRNFWQFLKRPAPLDPLQAGYFTKVNEALFDKKTDEMLELLKSLDAAVGDMLRHVDCPMIMDLLLKIISLERTEIGQGIIEWLFTQDVMPALISFLGPEHSWATQTSAADFMKAIITVSANASQNEQTCIGPNELTRQLVSQPCIEKLIGYMLGGGNPLTCGVGIIIEVIRKNNSDYDPDTGADANAPPSSRDPIYLGTLLRLFAQHVPDFMSLIMNAPAQKDLLTSTFGDRIEPLGFDRFKTCELMAELLHCSNMGLLNEVGAEEVIAARDSERERLRDEGRLTSLRNDEPPSSNDDLTMRVSVSSRAEETRKLEVTNSSSTDEDGFEEVTHAQEQDEDGAHGVEDMPDLPEMPSQSPISSFLDKDEDDFVDEPLSSPRLNVRALSPEPASAEDDTAFTDPDLMVAPLSPAKKHAEPGDGADKASELPQAQDLAQKTGIVSLGENGAQAEAEEGSEAAAPEAEQALRRARESRSDAVGSVAEAPDMPTPATAEHGKSAGDEQDPSRSMLEEKRTAPLRDLSPHPEDMPAPLFSGEDGAARAGSSVQAEPALDEAASKQDNNGTATQNPDTAGFDAAAAVTEAAAQSSSKSADEGSSLGPFIGDEARPGPAAPGSAPGTPVVGDYLKMQLVECQVVPTILGFFFKYPWNNFLHNVVYDIVQQVFNGPMDRGYNPSLAISLFEAADITSQIVRGQLMSEESQAKTKTRMGYMGHLTLIAEEVVKFTERQSPEVLSETVLDRVMAQAWISYVEGALAETRERDNAILGGVRPEVAMSNRATNAAGLVGMGLSGLASLSFGGGAGSNGNGGAGSNPLAEAGLGGGQDMSDNQGNGIGPFAISSGTLMSGFGSSSDEDEDEEQDNEEDVNNEVSSPMRGVSYPSALQRIWSTDGNARGGSSGPSAARPLNHTDNDEPEVELVEDVIFNPAVVIPSNEGAGFESSSTSGSPEQQRQQQQQHQQQPQQQPWRRQEPEKAPKHQRGHDLDGESTSGRQLERGQGLLQHEEPRAGSVFDALGDDAGYDHIDISDAQLSENRSDKGKVDHEAAREEWMNETVQMMTSFLSHPVGERLGRRK